MRKSSRRKYNWPVQQMTAPFRCLRIVVATAWAAGLSMAQSETVIDVTGYRPLATAVEQAEAALGIPINYEDVRYEHQADLEDLSTAAQRAEVPGYRLLGPRKGRVSGVLRAGRSGPRGGKMLDVAGLLSSYRANKSPCDFAVEEANGMLYVVPTQYLARDGQARPMAPVMNTPVSVAFAERTVWETVKAITDSVAAATGARVRVGTMPFFPDRKIGYGVSGASARDALAELFGKISTTPVSYQLFFDPAAGYMLNAHAVPAAASEPAAMPRTEPSGSSDRFFIKK